MQRVRALVNGTPKRLHVCTSCLKAGKVTRIPQRQPWARALDRLTHDPRDRPQLIDRPDPVTQRAARAGSPR